MKRSLMVLCCLVYFLFFVSASMAGESATPKEVVQKVDEAVQLVSKKGESCFPEFDDPNGKWVWGGTYVFIMKCENTALVTHPIKPALIGKDLSKLKDKNGNYFFSQLCEVGSTPEGGWVEYLWPKPGEKEPSRKITFCRQIPGTEFQAGAGIYDETITLKELNKLIGR